MQTALQVTFRSLSASPALEARIRDKAAKLESLHPQLTRCRVTIEQRHRHQHQGRQFAVRLQVRTPGHDIVVSLEHDEDVHVALRDAFDAAERQLEAVYEN